jgi:hypothetical protein
MNERIKELALQAKLWAIDNTNFPISSHIPAGYTEKFAELIVKEVLAVQEKFITNGHNAWHLNKPTREHFGVEE